MELMGEDTDLLSLLEATDNEVRSLVRDGDANREPQPPNVPLQSGEEDSEIGLSQQQDQQQQQQQQQQQPWQQPWQLPQAQQAMYDFGWHSLGEAAQRQEEQRLRHRACGAKLMPAALPPHSSSPLAHVDTARATTRPSMQPNLSPRFACNGFGGLASSERAAEHAAGKRQRQQQLLQLQSKRRQMHSAVPPAPPVPATTKGKWRKRRALTSMVVFENFVQRSGSHVDASGVLSRECFEAWVASRKKKLAMPEEAFRKALVARVTISDNGSTPFEADVEASLLRELRKRQVWPCFEGCTFPNGRPILIGSHGLRVLGFHERRKIDEDDTTRASGDTCDGDDDGDDGDDEQSA